MKIYNFQLIIKIIWIMEDLYMYIDVFTLNSSVQSLENTFLLAKQIIKQEHFYHFQSFIFQTTKLYNNKRNNYLYIQMQYFVLNYKT